MLKTRVTLLGVLALFIVSGIATSSASALGPYWHVAGARLSAGTKQLNLQIKGSAVLKSEIGGTPITITCTASESEGAAIEGNGTNQGQDKGRLKFTSCTVNAAGCSVATPITTNNTKSHLVTYNGAQSKYADLFEPTQGEVFAVVKITGTCILIGSYNVKGNVAAEVVPKEVEGQEGLVNFPETPIATVFLENVEKKIGLFLGATAAKFAAAYSGKLVTGEKFGVFGQ